MNADKKRYILLFMIFSLSNSLFGEVYTTEELKWLLPSDRWAQANEYLMKGQYLKINHRLFKGNKILGYKSLDFSMKNVASIDLSAITFNGVSCSVSSFFPNARAGYFSVCRYQYCSAPRELNDVVVINPYPNKKNILAHPDEGTKCPFEIEIFNSSDHANELVIKLDEYKPGKYLALNIQNEKIYFDINACNIKDNSDCALIREEVSVLERQITKMEIHKKKKDLVELNQLIEQMLPCVKKKDHKCVTSFFQKKESYEIHDSIIALSDEDYMELESCLSYDKLLPHSLSTRGIKKVCVINQTLNKTKPSLSALVYPEGIREKSQNNFEMYKEISK